MVFDSLVLFGTLIFSSLWISGCGGKKKKQKKPPGKSTETAKPLIVPEKKTEDTLKESKKSAKSKVDKPNSEMKEKDKSKKSEKKEEEKKEDEEKKEKEKEEKKDEEEEKKDEKGSEMKKNESKVEEKNDEEKEEEKKNDEKKDEKLKKEEKKEDKKPDEKKPEVKKPEEKKEDKKSDENPGGSEKPHISADPVGPLLFKADQSSQSKLTLKNIHDKKIMFKIKLSDNESFQVNPVFGSLEPGKTIDVAVTHRKSAPKEGKLVIVNNELTGDEKKVAELFKQVTKPTGGQVTVKWIAK